MPKECGCKCVLSYKIDTLKGYTFLRSVFGFFFGGGSSSFSHFCSSDYASLIFFQCPNGTKQWIMMKNRKRENCLKTFSVPFIQILCRENDTLIYGRQQSTKYNESLGRANTDIHLVIFLNRIVLQIYLYISLYWSKKRSYRNQKGIANKIQ